MIVTAKENFRDLVTDDSLHPALSPRETYFVLGVSQDMYRLMDDCGEPCLYPKHLFTMSINRVPDGWQFREYADDEYHLDPIGTAEPGFYEDYFGSDSDLRAQASARRTVLNALQGALRTATDEGERTILARDIVRLEAKHGRLT